MVESLILDRIETDLQITIGSLYPTIVTSSDGESTSNVYLRSDYVSTIEKQLMPYLRSIEEAKPDSKSQSSLAEEWLKLFGKSQDSISEDINE